MVVTRFKFLVKTVHQIKYRHFTVMIKHILYRDCITERRWHEVCFPVVVVSHRWFFEIN